MGFILTGIGAAVILLTLLPVWAIVGILGLLLVVFGVSMIL